MKKSILSFLIVFLIVFSTGCSSLFYSDRAEGYVTVKGTQFYLNGEPYYFVGTNFWYGCYIGSPGETGDRARLKRELDFLKENGITNLRILAASENSTIKRSLRPAITIEPGKYDEDLLEGLDFLLYEMGKRNIRGVVFLNNYWEWTGGFGQYNNWFGGGDVVDPFVPGSWQKFNEFVSAFYTNKEANEYFQKFIKMIITRKNKFSGNYYFEDPAIMAWELANEPRPGQGEDGRKNVPNYYRWIEQTAKYIKSLDPNHLVTTGNEGTMGSLASEEYFVKAHQIKEIDYATFHMWAKNWSWYKAEDKDGTFPRTKKNAVDYINRHMELARQIGKPITMEEFGISRDFEYYSPDSAVTVRDEYFQMIFNTIYDSAKAGAPIAGTNFWTWGGEGRAQHNDAIWQTGDEFTGDPPQEPQGLNSVFDSDKSTLKIIRDHAVKMTGLRNSNDLAAR